MTQHEVKKDFVAVVAVVVVVVVIVEREEERQWSVFSV